MVHMAVFQWLQTDDDGNNNGKSVRAKYDDDDKDEDDVNLQKFLYAKWQSFVNFFCFVYLFVGFKN